MKRLLKKVRMIMVLFLLVCVSVASADITTGLVAHYKCDEGTGSVLNDVINNNDGTITSGSWGAFGTRSVLVFDGNNTTVNCGSPEEFDFAYDFTWMGWVYPETDMYSVFKYVPFIQNGQHKILQRHRDFSAVTEDSMHMIGFVPKNRWTHYAFIRSESEAKLYIDGVLVTTQAPENVSDSCPTLVDNIAPSGLQSVYFDGDDKMVTSNSSLDDDGNGYEYDYNNYTVFIAGEFATDNPAGQPIFSQEQNGLSTGIFLGHDRVDFHPTNAGIDPNIAKDAFFVAAIVYNESAANACRLFINGSEIYSDNVEKHPSYNDYADDLTLGARDGAETGFKGYIGEVIVYRNALSEANIDSVNNYLMDKWINGVSATLSVTSTIGAWLDANDIRGDGSATAGDTRIGTWVDKSTETYSAGDAIATNSVVDNNDLIIAAPYDGPDSVFNGNRFKGKIADLRLYNRALSEADVLEGLRSTITDVDGVVISPVIRPDIGKIRIEVDAGRLNSTDYADLDTVYIDLEPSGGGTAILSTTASKASLDPNTHRVEVDLDMSSLTSSTTYRLEATAKNSSNTTLGTVYYMEFFWPGTTSYPSGPAGAKKLNNLVTEILNVPGPDTSGDPCSFTVSREGFIFISNEGTIGSEGSCPTLVDNIAPSGLQSVYFDGDDKMVTSNSSLDDDGNGYEYDYNNYTVFIAGEFATDNPAGQPIFSQEENGLSTGIFLGHDRVDFHPTNANIDPNIAKDTFFVAAIVYNESAANACRLFINGSEIYSDNVEKHPSYNDYADDLTLGARDGAETGFKGYIGEVIVYRNALSEANIDSVNNYLMDKWINGVSATLSVTSTIGAWLDANDIRGDGSATAGDTRIGTWADKSTETYSAGDAIAGIQSPVKIQPSGQPNFRLILKNDYGYAYETMAYVSAGDYTIKTPNAINLIVREVPMILYDYFFTEQPYVTQYGDYEGDFENKYIMPHINTLLIQDSEASNPYISELTDRGKLVLTGMLADNNTAAELEAKMEASIGFSDPNLAGIIVDEFSASEPKCGEWATAVDNILSDSNYSDKFVIPYDYALYDLLSSLWGADGNDFMNVLVEHGTPLQWETYLENQHTETRAWHMMVNRFVGEIDAVDDEYSGIAGKIGVSLYSFVDGGPQWLNITIPDMDVRVWMDMQMQFLATHPSFAALRGVGVYRSTYASEEMIRLMGKLFRHYCIEGNTERFLQYPYELSHIVNPDFQKELEGWDTTPAETGSIRWGSNTDFLTAQGRYSNVPNGSTGIIMKRSSIAANTFSQTITGLTAGDYYSFRMFSGDINNLTTSEEHGITITISDVNMVNSNATTNFTHIGGKGGTNYKINWHGRVFRANSTTATLTVSDWIDGAPGGPIGQELIFNFIRVQPYIFDTDDVQPAAWFDANDIHGDGSATANNTDIGKWVDKSPLYHHTGDAIQTTAVKKPTLIDGSAPSGLQTVEFDGTDDYMATIDSAFDNDGDGIEHDYDEYTIFVAGMFDSNNVTTRPMFAHEYDGVSLGQILSHDRADFHPNKADINSNITKGSFFIAAMVYDEGDPNACQLYVNGTGTYFNDTEKLVVSDDCADNLILGARDYGTNNFKGEIGEILIYRKALSKSQFDSVYGYLYDKWMTMPPGQASSPSPSDSATGVSIIADLSWTAGSNTTSHNVYFGTDSTPDDTEYKGSQAGITYDPGTLTANTTYYWRIDEVGLGGTTTGDVWSFTTTATPTYVAAGAVASGTGAITPALPSGIATNDILLLFLETSNEAISISNQNGGTWTQVTNSPQYCGTAAGTTGVRLTVFWSRYNGSQGAPTTSDSGNHQFGRMIAIRGATTSGNPWDVTAGGTEATSDTSGSIPGATTTVNTLVVAAIATSLPDASGTANFSSWTNANLTSLTERTDNTVTAGNGGGLGVATGVMATPGNYGSTDVTLGSSSYKAMMSIAIKP